MRLIGLSGYARSGKDEAAAVLMKYYNFERRAFADKLREFLYRLDPPLVGWYHAPADQVVSEVTLRDVIDNEGWDGYKEGRFSDLIRGMLQRLGTECGRELISDNIWVNAALKGLDSESKVVMTDARFPNEAQAIVDLGGEVWRINRTGVGPINMHPSETSLDNWTFDVTIDNDGTLEEYHEKIRSTYARGI